MNKVFLSLYLFVCVTASNCLLQSYAVLDTPGIFQQSRTKYVDAVLHHNHVRMDSFYDRYVPNYGFRSLHFH